MKTRTVSAFIEQNGGVLLHEQGPRHWDLPTTQVAATETDHDALVRHLKTLFEVAFTVDEVMADVELGDGSRVVHRVTLDMSNGPPRKQVVGALGFFGRARLDESKMPPELVSALK